MIFSIKLDVVNVILLSTESVVAAGDKVERFHTKEKIGVEHRIS
jgi:hypothetical protein